MKRWPGLCDLLALDRQPDRHAACGASSAYSSATRPMPLNAWATNARRVSPEKSASSRNDRMIMSLDVAHRAAEQHRVVRVEGRGWDGEGGPGDVLLLSEVSGDRRLVVGGVRVRRLDPVHVDPHPRGDQVGDNLPVADRQVAPPTVVVVLRGA